MFGLSADTVVVILVIVAWFVLMRWVFPRLGIST